MIRKILEAIDEKISKGKARKGKPAKPKIPIGKLGAFTKDELKSMAAQAYALGGVSPGPEDAVTPESMGKRYGAHHGAAYDLYPWWEAKLNELLESGEDFTAHWGSKKEIQWVTFQRQGGEVAITGEVQSDIGTYKRTMTYPVASLDQLLSHAQGLIDEADEEAEADYREYEEEGEGEDE